MVTTKPETPPPCTSLSEQLARGGGFKLVLNDIVTQHTEQRARGGAAGEIYQRQSHNTQSQHTGTAPYTDASRAPLKGRSLVAPRSALTCSTVSTYLRASSKGERHMLVDQYCIS